MTQNPNASTSNRRASPRSQRAQPQFLSTTAPPGFESLYVHERSKVTNLFQAFVLPLHSSLVRGGLRLRPNENTNALPPGPIPLNEITEQIPPNWNNKITTRIEEGTNHSKQELLLRYWDPADSSVHYEVKVIELVRNVHLVVMLFRAVNSYGIDGSLRAANSRNVDSHSSQRNSAVGNFTLQDYFTAFSFNVLGGQGGGAGVENKAWYELYRNLHAFESIVWDQLMEPIGISVSGRPREPGPYESRTSQQSQPQPQSQQSQQQPPMFIPTQPMPVPYPVGGIGGPLYTPPGIPAGGGLGRSDLDPLGGFGHGMIADPRGFRQPAIPPPGGGLMAPPPGARFDPFGPPMPTPRPAPPNGPGPGGPGFGTPNPDAEQPPPGFEDMFI